MWNLIGRMPGMQRALLQSPYGRRVLREAQNAEAEAWRLVGQEPPPASEDLLSVLSAITHLLESTRTGSGESQPVTDTLAPEPVVSSSRERLNGPSVDPSVGTAAVSPTEMLPPPADSREPPAYVSDLIRLLDWLALASGSGMPPGALKHLNREINRILSQAGVSVLSGGGGFDADRHHVIDTQPTEDPALVDTVANTVRAGYVYAQVLLRPQEVILFANKVQSTEIRE